MFSTKILALIFILFYTNTQSFGQIQGNLSTLQLLQVVYRHGDRTPLSLYPNDPYGDVSTYWPTGLGQLTERGKEQQYDLGSFLRQRYDGFLSDVYTRKEIHVLSSDTDRTLMSAEANLVGLFPAFDKSGGPVLKSTGGGGGGVGSSSSSSSTLTNKIGVQLIPIHTIMKEKDKLLHMSASCPRQSQARSHFYKTDPEIQRLTEENQDFLDYIVENSGTSVTGIFNIVTKVHDPLYVEQAHNMTLPEWVNSTVMEKLGELRGIGFAKASGTTELRRLNGGPLVGRLLGNMRKHTYNIPSLQHKMFMHSAHDDTIAAVMSSLDFFNYRMPPYAAALIIEFHEETETGRNYVEFYYRNSTHEPLKHLQIPGCGSPCYFSKLEELLRPVIPASWERECQTKLMAAPPTPTDTPSIIVYRPGYTTMICFLIVVATAGVIWLTIHIIVSKNKRILNASKEPIVKESYIEIV